MPSPHGIGPLARSRRTCSLLIALHLPTLFVAALADTVVTRAVMLAIDPARQITPFWAFLVYYVDFDIVSYVAVVAVAEALLVRGALVARQQLAKRLETSLSRARLDYLEAQLQPHFLFNSLGAVSELAYDAPATANRVLRQLIAIFRTALARKSDEVTLGEEIVGIEPYLDIQRIRFADWLTIDYHVDDGAVDCLLPRFILQPLVENAIRHGLSGRSAAGTIDISATSSRHLIVRVSDNGVGLVARASTAGRGIGLANVRDRLAIMYGDDDRLRLVNSDAGGTIAELTIPVRRRGESGAPAADTRTGVDRRHGSPRAACAAPVSKSGRLDRHDVAALRSRVDATELRLSADARAPRRLVVVVARPQRHDVGADLGAAHAARDLRRASGFPIRRDRLRASLAGFLVAAAPPRCARRAAAATHRSRGPLLAPEWQLTLHRRLRDLSRARGDRPSRRAARVAAAREARRWI